MRISDWSSDVCSSDLVAEVDVAVDLGRVGLAAAGGADAALVVGLADLVDDDGEGAADLGGELRGAARGGLFHDALIALFLDLLGHRIGGIGRASGRVRVCQYV